MLLEPQNEELKRASAPRTPAACSLGQLLAAASATLCLCMPLEAAGTVGTGDAASCTEAAFDAALAGGGVVAFDCGGPATITFTAAKIIAADTIINGEDGTVLSGGSSVNLFSVVGGRLEINNLTLADGRDSLASPGSPAIDADGQDVTVRDSIVRGHLTTEGGCPAIIISDGALVIERSTIHGNINQAAATGHPVCVNVSSTAEITSSTFTDNTGGSLRVSGVATVVNSTIAANVSTGAANTSGPIAFSSGIITLINTVVANNEGTGQCSESAGGTIIDGGGNFQFPDASCGAAIPVADPFLVPLADNGGPTPTMAIVFPSAAVDAASQADCPPTDQRGEVAFDGDGNGSVLCDAGAYEATELVTLTAVPTASAMTLFAFAIMLTIAGCWIVGRSR